MLIVHRIFVAGCFALMLAACGSSSDDSLFGPGSPVNAAVGGLWDGTGTDDLEPGLVVRIIGVVAEDGRAE